MTEHVSKGELHTAAITFHELFQSYVEAGFSESQALYLIGKHIEASTGSKPE